MQREEALERLVADRFGSPMIQVWIVSPMIGIAPNRPVITFEP
ncbi:MAG: hypothetical protein R3C00_13515 [Hyphomonas sp.]